MNEQQINDIRKDFPILSEKIYKKDLIYFDNGATTQKPRAVVEKIEEGYYHTNANIHRGVHYLSQKATEAHEAARCLAIARTKMQEACMWACRAVARPDADC